jgi:phosphoserine phosphatase
MHFRTVVFDCDSTLSAIEGIDELAREHRNRIAALTDDAMAGRLPLEAVYGRRLELIRPTRAALDALGDHYIRAQVPGAAEVVRRLHDAGVVVQVLSGGLAPAVRHFTLTLGIAAERVAAVEVYFDAAGGYLGFDADSPLARSGGKRAWIAARDAELPRPILLVGDGMTDLEARPAVDCFAAFAGVVRRPDVVKAADLVLAGPSLSDVLPLVLPMK